MRILVAQPGPAFSVHDVYMGWTEALSGMGVKVIPFNLDERLSFYGHAYLIADPPHATKFRKALTDQDKVAELALNGLYAALYKTRPDVLLVVSAFLVPPEMLDLARSYGTRVVILHTEEPYELDRELKIAEHADVNLINDPTHLEKFQALDGVARYVPHSYRSDLHRPGPVVPDASSEFCFVGTAFRHRIEFLERMNLDGIDVALAGAWKKLDEDSPLRKYLAHDIETCCDNDEAVTLYQSSKMSINIYRREANDPSFVDGWAMGPREVEMAACGLPFLRDPRGEGDEVFPMLPTFTSPEEAGEKLRWWLAHEDERRDLAVQAREAIADRTFSNSAAQLLRLLDK